VQQRGERGERARFVPRAGLGQLPKAIGSPVEMLPHSNTQPSCQELLIRAQIVHAIDDGVALSRRHCAGRYPRVFPDFPSRPYEIARRTAPNISWVVSSRSGRVGVNHDCKLWPSPPREKWRHSSRAALINHRRHQHEAAHDFSQLAARHRTAALVLFSATPLRTQPGRSPTFTRLSITWSLFSGPAN